MQADKANLRDLGRDQIALLVSEAGLERYRTDQIFRWVHERGVESIDQMTDLSLEARQKLQTRAQIEPLSVDLEQISTDGTRKYRLRTHDGRMIETVLIPAKDANDLDPDENDEHAEQPEHLQHALFPRKPKLTQCVSSQVGCALDCTFCATAQLGFGRQLSTGEILDQVYLALKVVAGLSEDDATKRAGGDELSNLVFMGMGEPLHNYANVVRAVALLTDQKGANFSKRRITISTAGLVPGIEKLAKEPLQVNLAVSLNATTDEVRDEIMPINRKWNIGRLLEAVRKFPLDRRRRVTFEYVLLDGVNDSDEDATRLERLLRGIPSKVNLLAWNPHDGAPYRRPTEERIKHFQDTLKAAGMAVYVRKSRGRDIDAACGQLAGREQSPRVIPPANLAR